MSSADPQSREFIASQLKSLDARDASYATQFVDSLLRAASRLGVSDIHLHPEAEGLAVRWRIDGVLQPLGQFARGEAADVVARLKVLAELLTYKTDVPQEGRLRRPQCEPEGPEGEGVEMRVSTFPTLHGERAVVRLFAADTRLLYPEELGLPAEVLDVYQRILAETSGAILICGPAGSGKTTTAYAGLRELVRRTSGRQSIVTLEDPIEVPLDGVAQSQVNANAGFDLATGLRSLMRQDPEVLLVGEIRDRETAETAFQASLTGHLVLSTFHAATAGAAISRLADMGIESYLLRSGLLGIVCQRLVRRLCACAQPFQPGEQLGLKIRQSRQPQGCPNCLQTGYLGRMLLAEVLLPEPNAVGRAILSRCDAPQLQQLAVESGMVTCRRRALDAVEAGQTSPQEVRRVLGFQQG